MRYAWRVVAAFALYGVWVLTTYLLEGLPRGPRGAFLAAQDAPDTSLIATTNVFAQVLPVSVAEVLVCWSLVGAVAGSSMSLRASRVTQAIVVSIVASVTFGVYHVTHSAPFNTPGMIAMLTAVGVVSSIVFVLLRDVYGTITFHNCLAVYGVLGTLTATGKVSESAQPSAPLLITALVSLAILIVARTLLLREGASRRPTTGVP